MRRASSPSLLFLLLCGLWGFQSPDAIGQAPPWRIYSPAPDTLVQEGELFLVVGLDQGVLLDSRSVRLFLDGREVTQQAKISETTVRLLYTHALGGGRHEVFLTARRREGSTLPELRWTFLVDGAPTASLGRAGASPPRQFGLTGHSDLDTRNSDFSGRRDLRQEPDRTYAFNLDAEGAYGAFTFPVKVYATTDDNSTSQPRNRFLIGARSPHLSLLFGDTTPLFNPLMLNGTRSRGVQGAVSVGPVALSSVYGLIRRGIAPDALRPGAFERTLSAARLSLGNPKTVLFSLDGMRAQDMQTSIAFNRESGIRPMENLLFGSDLQIRLRDGRYTLEGGGAFSVTTEDISRGPATKAEIDEQFSVDLPFDPADLEWLITLNASTVPLSLDGLSSLAWYAKGRAGLLGHTLTAEYRSVGDAFTSFGNPFLQNDRRTLTVADRFKALQGKLSGNLRFRRFTTLPRSDPRLSTLEADLLSGQVVLAPWKRPTWLYVGYRLNTRTSTAEGTGQKLNDTQGVTYTGGGYHLLQTGGFQHGLTLSATYGTLEDLVRPSLNNTTRTLTAGLNEQFPIPLYLSVQVNRLTVNSDELGDWQRLTTFTGKLGYRLEPRHLNFALSLQNTHTAETTLLPVSDRYSVLFQTIYEVLDDMDLELQLGYSAYREPGTARNRYTDRYVVIRHRYTF